MEWLVLVTEIFVGRVFMAILPYYMESLLYSVSMVCTMDLKSYKGVSVHSILLEFSLQTPELIIYDNACRLLHIYS